MRTTYCTNPKCHIDLQPDDATSCARCGANLPKYDKGQELETEEFGECTVSDTFIAGNGRVAYTVRPMNGPAEFMILEDEMTS